MIYCHNQLVFIYYYKILLYVDCISMVYSGIYESSSYIVCIQFDFFSSTQADYLSCSALSTC